MSMKLSYRDKVIIIVVAVLVVLGVGIFCFIKPKFADLQVSKDRLAAKQAEEAEVKAKMDTLDDLKKRLEDDVKAVEETQKKFVSERENGETYQISKYLMDKLYPAGIEITGMNMDRLSSTDLEAYTYDKYAVAYPLKINADIAGKLPPEVGYVANNSYPKNETAVQVAGTLVTVSYKCDDNKQVFDAIQAVADNEENIYLLNATASYVEGEKSEDGKIDGELNIMFYEIYPLDPEDIDAEIVVTTAEESAE